jgi:hypothetical protein
MVHLPNKHEASNSNPSTARKKKKHNIHTLLIIFTREEKKGY